MSRKLIGTSQIIKKWIRKMKKAEHKPISIKRITLEYQNGTKLVVNEAKTPVIGKLFFNSIKENEEIKWEIIEKGNIFTRFFKSLFSLFEL